MKKIYKKYFSQGFTLIEILVAVAILSTILSMVYTILLSTLYAKKLVQTELEIDRIGNRLLFIISRDIQCAYIYSLKGSYFVGESTYYGDRIDFITNKDSFFTYDNIKSDLCEVSYYLKPNPKGKGVFKLIRRESFFIDKNPRKGGIYIRLYDRVTDLKFRYITKDRKIKDKWDSKREGGLPEGVEIILGLKNIPRDYKEIESTKENTRYFITYAKILVSPKNRFSEKNKKKKKKKKRKDYGK